MDEELNQKLLNLINEGKSILREIPSKKQVRAELEYHNKLIRPSPEEASVGNIAQEYLGDVLQGAAKEFLSIPKKYTRTLRSYPKRQQKSLATAKKEELKKSIELDYRYRLDRSKNQYLAWDRKLKDFLSKVSIIDNGKVILTSKQLLQRVLRAGKFLKIDTRIRHIVSFLEEYSVYTVVLAEAIEEKKEKFILGGRKIKGENEIENILQTKTKNYIKICDEYFQTTSIEFFEVVPKGISIKVLTRNTGGKEKEKRLLKKLQKLDEVKIEIRKIKPFPSHMRYILTKGKAWHLSHSLKDLGKKDSFIQEIKEEIRKIEKRFDELWKEATPLKLG